MTRKKKPTNNGGVTMEKTKEVLKPLTVMVDDFENGIIKQINDSRLPFFVVASSFEKILAGVKETAAQQLQADRAAYNKELQNQKADSE